MPAKKKAKKATTKQKIKHSAKPAAKRAAAPARKKPAGRAPAARTAASPVTRAAVATRPVVARPAPSKAEEFAIEAARCMDDDKCTDVVVLDVRGKNPMTDFLVIGSGTSDRQMRAVLHHIQDLGETLGYQAVRSTSDDRATWLLADFMNVITHLFEPNTRAHYDLEMMWGDTARVDWERPGTGTRDRAGLHSGQRG
ncbi:MAG: ribosome silencing factor [Phycisphaeraceae bacterium]|nr:ribosome silencing factor [Phycisphaeraceae bacterium]